jgi:hypothetical protein
MATRGLPRTDWWPAHATLQPARSARALRPLGVAQDARSWPTRRCPHPRWVRTEHAVMVERASRVASVVRQAASGYGMSHDKVFTVSTQGAR